MREYTHVMIKFSAAAQANIDELGLNPYHDVYALVVADITQEELLAECLEGADAVLEEQRLTKEEADINSLYAEFCDWNQFKRVEVLKTLRERATTSSEHSDDIQAAWACAYVLFRDHKRK